MAVVGVIPAAGFATRLQPLHCSKEVYPVAGKPVMDYLVERMAVSGCDEIRVVTRPEKVDVVKNAARHRLRIVEARPASVSDSIAAGMEGLADDDVVLLGFPDTIWEPKEGFLTLLSKLDPGFDLVLGLFRTGEPERCDVVILDEADLVTDVESKPVHARSPWVWGCAAGRARLLSDIGTCGEPGEYFRAISKRERIKGVKLSNEYTDIGTRSALSEVGE